jgi:molybdate transport system substrate-binding protein
MTMSRVLKKWLPLIVVLLLSAMVAGCSPAATTDTPATAAVASNEQTEATEAPAEQPPAAGDTALTVFAAASLTDAFTEIGRLFEAEQPNVTVAFNFAGSNQLATQIGEGAPADVFASANAAQMDVAVESGRIDAAAPRMFVTNRLVVVYPADNPAGIAELADLAQPDTLLVLAAEEVPVGRYSLEFLDKAAADPAFGATFKDDVLANVVSYEENVRSVLNKVALGEADAGIVYTSDLVGVEGVSQLEIPDTLNILAEYPIAALNDSAYGDAAAAFVEYVLGAEGQAILAEYGFGPVAP